MKLRNKKTGETGELIHLVSINLGNFKQYKTLEDLYQEWETYIPVVSRQNGKSITNLYLAAKQAGMPLDKIKELVKDVYGYDC